RRAPQPHGGDRRDEEQGRESEDRKVPAGPGNAQTFPGPEHAERGQHDADCELDCVLGHARQRTTHGETHRADQRTPRQPAEASPPAPLRASMRPMRNTVSPAPDGARTAASACSAATTTAIPMPQLNTRCISASATLPSCCSQSKTAGRGQEALSMTARVFYGRMRGTLPTRPPPVI